MIVATVGKSEEVPLEYLQPDELLPTAERRQAGQRLRRLVPRNQHASWTPSSGRRDPLEILAETSRHRISWLVPIRYGRMRTSPFTFLRGSAAVMAADLATTPTSGIWVQSCGDSHLANFGVYSGLDGTPVFDVIDFDETLPAPFEWDIKRLAVSFTVAARCRNMPERPAGIWHRETVSAYRGHMAKLMQLDPQRAWHSRVDVNRAVNRHRGPEAAPARIETPARCGAGPSQGLPQAAGAPQIGLAYPSAIAGGYPLPCQGMMTRLNSWPAPLLRHTR